MLKSDVSIPHPMTLSRDVQEYVTLTDEALQTFLGVRSPFDPSLHKFNSRKTVGGEGAISYRGGWLDIAQYNIFSRPHPALLSRWKDA